MISVVSIVRVFLGFLLELDKQGTKSQALSNKSKLLKHKACN